MPMIKNIIVQESTPVRANINVLMWDSPYRHNKKADSLHLYSPSLKGCHLTYHVDTMMFKQR